MIITAIIGCTAGAVARPQKSLDIIKQQMERIYKLYGQGYGTTNMMQNCEEKVYIIFTKIKY